MPSINLPVPIKAYLDSFNLKYLNLSDNVPDQVQQILSNGFVDDGRSNTMFIYVGLLFDGNVKYRNLTNQLGRNGSTVLIPGPTIKIETHPVDVAIRDNLGVTRRLSIFVCI